jgi:hypothetical protein
MVKRKEKENEKTTHGRVYIKNCCGVKQDTIRSKKPSKRIFRQKFNVLSSDKLFTMFNRG